MSKSILKRRLISTLLLPLASLLIFTGCSKEELTVHSATNSNTTPQQNEKVILKGNRNNANWLF